MRLQRRVLLALLALAGVALLAAASRRAPAAGDPRIYDSPLVTPAPLSPLQSAQSSFRFEDARGSYERVVFNGSAPPAPGAVAPFVNLIFTRAGHLRSGDIHRCEQLNHVVFGALRLTQRLRGRDVTTRHSSGDVMRIPPHVPHLYAFDLDTLMTEAWRTPRGEPCEFRAWLYAPYRERIPPATTDKRFDAAGGG